MSEFKVYRAIDEGNYGHNGDHYGYRCLPSERNMFWFFKIDHLERIDE